MLNPRTLINNGDTLTDLTLDVVQEEIGIPANVIIDPDIRLLVDKRGMPLAIHITGANEHDKWSADELIISIVVKRPKKKKQHLCADKGYDYDDVHDLVEQARYIAHIKHRRRRGEPIIEHCPIPGETQYPARRWVVERTLGWLTKRRSIRVRWCKKFQNWKAFIEFACAHILFNRAFYG